MDEYTYNYYCFNEQCSTYATLQHINKTEDKEHHIEYCIECRTIIKLVGKSTCISLQGGVDHKARMNKAKR